MCTGATHGVGVWPGADVVPHQPDSRQSVWRDSVALTAVARLTGHMSCDAWPPVTPKQVV
jgi:hypothetical protein